MISHIQLRQTIHSQQCLHLCSGNKQTMGSITWKFNIVDLDNGNQYSVNSTFSFQYQKIFFCCELNICATPFPSTNWSSNSIICWCLEKEWVFGIRWGQKAVAPSDRINALRCRDMKVYFFFHWGSQKKSLCKYTEWR